MLTKDRALQPTVFWRDLTPPELAIRLETSDDLLRLLQWHRGDPRLSAWEEAFLTGMSRTLQKYRGKVPPSTKQWGQINRILDKVESEDALPAEEEA